MVLFAADHIRSKSCPWKHFRRVEHTELETAVEGSAEVAVEHIFLDEAFLKTFLEDLEHSSALEVCTVEDSVYRCFKRTCMSLVLALSVEIVDRVAVCEDYAVEAPFAAEDIHEKTVACTAWNALITVVCAHDLAYISFLDEGLEGRKVCLPEVTHRYRRVVCVSQWLRTAVYRIVLCACMGLEILVVISLHSEYVLYSKDGIQVWVLAV